MKKELNKQIKITDKITSQLIKLGVVLLIIMLTVQLAVLAVLGTKGGEVTQIRAQKQFYRQEIDNIQAKIANAQTLAQIENGIDVVYREDKVAAKPIEINAPRDYDDTVGLAK